MKVKLNILSYKVKKVERVRDRLSRKGGKISSSFLGGGGGRNTVSSPIYRPPMMGFFRLYPYRHFL
jgi:hypothetical protein